MGNKKYVATFSIMLGILTMLTMHSQLCQTIYAATTPYSPPCNDTDIEIRGDCCPSDTVQRAHNMCLTQDEVQQRREDADNFMRCAVDRAVHKDVGGSLGCLNELSR
jgi:hypothetical protein